LTFYKTIDVLQVTRGNILTCLPWGNKNNQPGYSDFLQRQIFWQRCNVFVVYCNSPFIYFRSESLVVFSFIRVAWPFSASVMLVKSIKLSEVGHLKWPITLQARCDTRIIPYSSPWVQWMN